ncbi:unnamed protein product [Ilex paraguariensis]|uniref:Mechanosensitive ion channel MscS domain-containing protein n=1 Tax=Ilex paraguariensis TaxID=185542 RepID=A0ABC8U9N0_9AQUA
MYLLVEQSDLQVPFSSLMDKLRKSFKSDQRHPNHPEERQILLNQSENPMASQSTDLGDRKDVVIKITGKENSKQTEIASQSPSPSQISDRGSDTTGKMWGDSSYDFSNDVTLARVAREFDFTTDSPLSQRSPLSRIPESPNYGQVSPREVRVSFNETTTESVRRRSNAGAELIGGEQQEVLVCSSNSSFRQKSSLLRTKSKSRLMDPPEDQRSQRLMKSGMIGKVSEIDEDDPFLEEDLPDEYKTMKFSTLALLQWVSLILIIAALVNAFRERRALALSLNDTKTAVNKLHHMLNVLVGLLIVVIWLLILKVATTHFFIFLSSQLLLVVFMFGNTCKTTFESIVFLFVLHPYDVGDRVEVEGVQMIVEEMNILTTVFLRFDSLKITYPNTVLSTKPISNYYRSPDMGDSIDFCIHISTPMEKIAKMKERITRYIETKGDHWHPAPMIVLRDVEDMNRLKISIWLSHRMNHQDMGERWARRALLVEEMIKVFKELDVEYRMLPLDMNIRHMPALTSNRLPSIWTASST